MDTGSSSPDIRRLETKELEGTWPQQTFCQGGDNLQPFNRLILCSCRSKAVTAWQPRTWSSHQSAAARWSARVNASWESRRVNIANKSAAIPQIIGSARGKGLFSSLSVESPSSAKGWEFH